MVNSVVPIQALQWYRFADIINKISNRWKKSYLPAVAVFFIPDSYVIPSAVNSQTPVPLTTSVYP